jgi:hypothetical protein
MPVAFIVGPLAALVGIVAIFFVFRRKAVDKRSMYSARRSQIEHKVRAARQRTLAPQPKVEKEPEAAPPEVAATSVFAPSPAQPRVTYEPSAYIPPPAAVPPVKEEVGASPWDIPPTATPPPPAPGPYMAPEPPAPLEEWTPAPAPVEPPKSSEPVWTPAPAPTEPETVERAAPVEPKYPATPAAAPGSWSVVSEAAKESASTGADQPRTKGRQESSAWQLASGEAPGMEEPEEVAKAPSAAVAIAQYAVLVVGLVMVLIGVFVMIANSHVT